MKYVIHFKALIDIAKLMHALQSKIKKVHIFGDWNLQTA